MDKNLRLINDLEKNETIGNDWYNRDITLDELVENLGKLRNASSYLQDDDLHPKFILFSCLFFRTVHRCLTGALSHLNGLGLKPCSLHQKTWKLAILKNTF